MVESRTAKTSSGSSRRPAGGSSEYGERSCVSVADSLAAGGAARITGLVWGSLLVIACSSGGSAGPSGGVGGAHGESGGFTGVGGAPVASGGSSSGGVPGAGGGAPAAGGSAATTGGTSSAVGVGGIAGGASGGAPSAAGGGGRSGLAGAGGASSAGGSAGSSGAAGQTALGAPPPPLVGTAVAGTVSVTRGTTMGRLPAAFAGFSFEKSHMTDGFFSPTHSALVGMFKLLGNGVVRIGADDVNTSVWQPNATTVAPGTTSPNTGTAEVDALGAFLTATGWKTIYSVNMRPPSTPATAVAEATYVAGKLGASVAAFEIGNELNLYGPIGTIQPIWDSYAKAIHAALPNTSVAGPGIFEDIGLAVPFIQTESSQIQMVTHHYYRGTAGQANATLANLLAADPTVVSQSQALAGAVSSNNIREGYRWGEMNSYSSHGQMGASDVLGSALWGINFMLTTARYGSAGVNFHGGGQNMDGNVCPNGAASCNRPFRYSPLLEVDSRVTAAAPLFYGMLLVSQAGVGAMLATTASAGQLNFTSYAITAADGSTHVVLVNSDATRGVNASVNMGQAVATASAIYLRGSSLTATTGLTLAGAPVTPQGTWAPQPAFAVAHTGNVLMVPVPAASAVLLTVN